MIFPNGGGSSRAHSAGGVMRGTREIPHLSAGIKKNEQVVWQRRFREHRIRDETDFSNHVASIHYNPVKHGLAAAAREWPYSSFHRYVAEGLCAAEWGVGKNIRLPEVVGRE